MRVPSYALVVVSAALATSGALRVGAPVALAAESADRMLADFEAALAQGRDSDAQDAGKKLLTAHPDDAAALAVQGNAAPRLAVVAADGTGAHLTGLDGFLHFGHGLPDRVVDGLDAATVAALRFERAPFVVSGACFNGALGRS